MSKTLAVIPQNKPTKAEILEALTQLKFQQRMDERKERDEEKKRLEAECDQMLMEYVKENVHKFAPRISFGHLKRNWETGNGEYLGEIEGVEARFDLNKLPSRIEKKIVKLKQLENQRIITDYDAIKKEIRDGLNGIQDKTERVKALLADEESRKGLEAMLKEISK